jgi:antitoxin MazE
MNGLKVRSIADLTNTTPCNYDVIMKTQIIQIGNSQGIRIPKVLLEETKMTGEVDLEVREDGILIRNIQKPRGDWDAIFTSLAENDDDETLDAASSPTAFEKKGWQW